MKCLDTIYDLFWRSVFFIRTCWTWQQIQQISWTWNFSWGSSRLLSTGFPSMDSTSQSATWRVCRWLWNKSMSNPTLSWFQVDFQRLSEWVSLDTIDDYRDLTKRWLDYSVGVSNWRGLHTSGIMLLVTTWQSWWRCWDKGSMRVKPTTMSQWQASLTRWHK